MDMGQLLKLSVERKASDLYLSAGAPPIFRIFGDLVPLENEPPIDAGAMQTLLYSIMDKQQQKVFEETGDLDFGHNHPEVGNFRVNVFRQVRGMSGVFRIIPDKLPSLEEVGVPAFIKNLLNLPNGLILVTGPTGCGKSTSLAAMMNYINTNKACHIITIEDPIEFTYQNKKSLVDQREVLRDTATFSTALRAALREAPDVILVGEMRDLETIRLVLTAAETGHLVVGTLHTSSAPRAVTRMVDVFPAGEKNIIRNLVSESLQAVICQTLVKKIGGGRVAAFEIMLGTPAIRNLIREDKVSQMTSVMQTSSQIGMCTMEQSFQALIAKQLINPEEAHHRGFQRELFEKT